MVNGPQRMAPKPLALMKDTSSSSGKVFARPSKEWVVPERTKPGRKISAEEPDNKRQSQNRQSQRAHRARRTDYITTLEERLRQYEADEIHSNVRLQEVARALKADNERLKKENAEIKAESEGLKRENGGLRMQLEGKDSGRRLSAGSGSRRFSTPRTLTNRSSPAGQTTSRPTIACPICPDPDPDCPCQKPSTDISSASLSSAPFATLSLAAKALEDHDHGPSHASSGIESKITLTDSSCGVCRSDDECLCRVLKEEEAKERVVEVQEVNTASEGCGLCTSAAFCACKVEVESPKQSTSARQAVSLSLKRSRVTSGPKAKVWDFTTSSTIDSRPAPRSLPEAVACSGDPSNCQACKDDSFGQEFCSNLYSNPAIAKPCDDCPGNCMSISSLLNDDAMRGRDGSTSMEREGTMTPDTAWKALKAHPNSKLASLSLLADVVARHTKCVGYDDPVSASASTTARPTTSHAGPTHSQNATGGPPITPNISGRGFRRRLEVETSGLRDALKVLDGFSQGPSSAENSPKRRKVELANDW